ncbi:LLM class flavin-dependent oxidoreductase [Subtercola endophyticus]|uniref:LLM class flavin-dependent oxidoreductase n=1 Tax=Subtercola endophyticus TaxID=2895559 RepID=UPI001E3EFB82|nr:LLM class flavin-dependent oxidoreductase [Subtercola endophyticus]UFS59146.1 LLM class flavin-dependent oxidoreductase [Subtercola endophyticus]
MKFITIDLISASGALGEAPLRARERLHRVVDNAVFAESLGFDSVGIGEHHEQGFLATAPTVVLSVRRRDLPGREWGPLLERGDDHPVAARTAPYVEPQLELRTH